MSVPSSRAAKYQVEPVISLPTGPAAGAGDWASRASSPAAVSPSSLSGVSSPSQPSTVPENTPAAGVYTTLATWFSEALSWTSSACLDWISWPSCPAALVSP